MTAAEVARLEWNLYGTGAIEVAIPMLVRYIPNPRHRWEFYYYLLPKFAPHALPCGPCVDEEFDRALLALHPDWDMPWLLQPK